MGFRVITDEEDRADFIRFVSCIKLPLTVEWRKGRDRTLDQNRLQWLWAGEVAHQSGDETENVRADWKLRHGVPILRESSEKFRGIYDRLLKPLPYEEKKQAMRDLDIPVTSAFKVPEMVRYLDCIERECHEAGFQITAPDPDLSKYHSRYRAKEVDA